MDAQRFSFFPAIPLPQRDPLAQADPHPCAYLPAHETQLRAFWARELSGEEYQQALDAGFRRSGYVVYQPVCRGCRRCVSLRVPVAAFAPSKTQRRCWRKNADLQVHVGRPEPTQEKWHIYRRYQEQWHTRAGGTGQPTAPAEFVETLYDSPTATREFVYRDGVGTLLAVGICDVTPLALSSVYFFFDPAYAARSLGTFGALCEIAWAREHALRYWYAGFWVHGCRKMEYKAAFRPHEILCGDGVWRSPVTAPQT